MSQFILLQSLDARIRVPPCIKVRRITKEDALLSEVALAYFGGLSEAMAVTDASGASESLFDDVHDLLRDGADIAVASIVVLTKALIDVGDQFVCWCGGDYRNLPRTRSWAEVELELRSQCKLQPADVSLQFSMAAEVLQRSITTKNPPI